MSNKDRPKDSKVKSEPKSEGMLSAADWVAKSRAQDKNRKIQTPTDVLKKMQELDEQDALVAELDHVPANLRVIHDPNQIHEGTEMILTLKDSRVLNEKGNEVNDEADALENVHMTADERRQYLKRQTKSAYNVYDDLEGKIDSILPQYDDKNMKFKQETGFTLDQEGEFGSGKAASGHHGDLDRADRLGGGAASSSSSSSSSNFVDLQKLQQALNAYKSETSEDGPGVGGFKVQSDYMTQEEANVKFRKSQPKTKLRRKVKPQEVIQQLEAMEEEHEGADHGSRTRSAKLEREAQKAIEALANKEKAYRLAKQKAEETRAAMSQLAKTTVTLGEAEHESLRIEGEDTEGNIIFDPTEEFANHLLTAEDLVANARKKAEKMNRQKEATSAAAAAAAAAASSAWRETNREDEDEDEDKVDDESDEEEKRQKLLEDTDVFVEPRASGTLSAALELIRQKGWITEQFSGRNNDAVVDLRQNDPAPQINLERKDETGMEMTQKEAYRRLSHKFHSKTPGKNKLEKKMRKMHEERKIQAMSAIDTPLASVQALQNAQQVTKSPFVVIQGGGVDHMGLQPAQSKKERRKLDQDRPGGSESTVNKRMKV